MFEYCNDLITSHLCRDFAKFHFSTHVFSNQNLHNPPLFTSYDK